MLKIFIRMLLLMIEHLLFGIRLQLIERVELTDILDKLIIQLRQLFLLDLMKLNLKGGVLSLELLGIFFREGNVDVKLFASTVATTCSSKPGIN